MSFIGKWENRTNKHVLDGMSKDWDDVAKKYKDFFFIPDVYIDPDILAALYRLTNREKIMEIKLDTYSKRVSYGEGYSFARSESLKGVTKAELKKYLIERLGVCSETFRYGFAEYIGVDLDELYEKGE